MSTKILLAGYPKSGNTWLGYMLSYLLNAEYIEPYNFLAGIMYSKDVRILTLTSGNLIEREKTKYHQVIKTHQPPHKSGSFKDFPALTDKIILIIRDPRDVAVSYYFYQKLFKENSRTGVGTLKHISFFNTLNRWNKYHKSFIGDKIFIVKYEDLITRCHETLSLLLDYLDIQCHYELIEDAINQFKIEKMKGNDTYSSKFFRKGISGDYRNYFNKIDYFIYKYSCMMTAKKIGYQ